MNSYAKLLLFVIGFFVIYRIIKNNLREHVSMGTITQLMAKGPQDIYLSGDAEKWVRWQYPFGYPNLIWNNPTRLYNYNYLYPYYFYPYYPIRRRYLY
jgi:hypothetical protein